MVVLRFVFAVILVSLVGAQGVFADDPGNIVRGRAIVEEQRIFDEFTGDAGAGIAIETLGNDGTRAVGVVQLRFGDKVTERIVYTDGTVEVRKIRAKDLLAGGVGIDVKNGSVAFVDVSFGRTSETDKDGYVEQTLFVLRYFNDGRPVALESRIYDTTAQWDVLGRSLDDRALRVGLGAGLNGIYGSHDNEGGIALVYPKVTAVYAFTPSLRAEGTIEVLPLIRAGKLNQVWGGAVGNASAELQWKVSDHVLAVLSARYQAANFHVRDSETGITTNRSGDFLQTQIGVRGRW